MGDPFVVVPKYVVREAPEAVAVYCAIRLYADFESGVCYPSIETIANDLGISRSTVERRLVQLVEIGAIEKTSRAEAGRTNVYRFPAQRFEGYVTSDVGGTSAEKDRYVTGDVQNEEPLIENHLTTREIAPARKRDLLWETFVEIHGEPATPSERGKFNRIVADLRAASVEPSEYPTLVAAYSAKYDGLQPAAATVSQRIGELRHFVARGPIRTGTGDELERRRRFAVLEEQEERRLATD